MKAFLIRLLIFLIPVLAGACVIFMIPYDREYGYRTMFPGCGEQGRWLYDRIFLNPKNIDAAFIGTSHTMSAIEDSAINGLFQEKRSPVTVANLGFCRAGRDLHYEIVKDLLQQKKVKLLFVEVMEREQFFSHPDYPYLASNRDLFSPPVKSEEYSKILMTGLAYRWDYQKARLFETFEKDRHWMQDYSYYGHDHIADSNELANWAKKQKERYKGVTDDGGEFSKKWLQAIGELAARNKVQVLFLYIPEYGSPVKEPLNDYLKSQHVLLLPDTILNNPAHWTDVSHLNRDAALKLAPYFVRQIENLLKED
jgi:hypothetical protein